MDDTLKESPDRGRFRAHGGRARGRSFFTSLTLLMFLFPNLHATWAEQTLKALTLEQKVGQLFMVGVCSKTGEEHLGHHTDLEHVEKLVRDYHVGGFIFFRWSAQEQVETINKLQGLSTLPLLIGQDCEWGLGMRITDAQSFPKNATLAELEDESLLYEFGKEVGEQCRTVGVHINFAPVVDINTNPDNPIIGDRSFGNNKELVARKGMLVMQGLQDSKVLACAKHFPGHGDTDLDSHLDLPVVNHPIERLEAEELYPFKVLIDAGVASIMTAHIALPALDPTNTPASLSRPIVTDLLQNRLGFGGLVITDALSMEGAMKGRSAPEAALGALLAGNDILLCPTEVEGCIAQIVQALQKKELSLAELDKHVLKILRTKEMLGLHDNRFVKTEGVYERLHAPQAEELQDIFQIEND